ncbi:hypothetical protein GGR57DRAFT_499824 [Xylariaceae sp. FL1272]|nr:hypothetical protein GGR57DRAFT_499824 [Xylariaceae sp. FL1272]
MLLLTGLPPEILHEVLGYVDPTDLAAIPRVCHALYRVVKGNEWVFKQVYLHHLDTPPSQDGIQYEKLLKDFVRLEAICRGLSVHAKKTELSFVHEAVTRLLKNASHWSDSAEPESAGFQFPRFKSRNADILARIFSDDSNKSAFLCRSFIYERARAGFHDNGNLNSGFYGPSKPEYQKSAHLHCLFGVPQLAIPPVSRETRRSKMSPFACSKVYDLRQYNERNQWGPFTDDGTMRVDWEKVEAVMIVLGANMANLSLSRFPMCDIFTSAPFTGTWPGSWKSPHNKIVPPPPDSLEHLDPYGVSGIWMRVVCFLDYTDFFSYNFASDTQLPLHVPRPAIDYGEATRLIFMSIFVTAVEPPGPEDGQDLPVVHFKGVSRSADRSFDDNADSDLRGTVRLTPEGEVRWTTYSIFGGVERWRSESVQVGGVKSAKGVLGHWFDKDFDPRGPAGPTAFWKVSDKIHRAKSGGEDDDSDDGMFDDLDIYDELDGNYVELEVEFIEEEESDEDEDDSELEADLVEHTEGEGPTT